MDFFLPRWGGGKFGFLRTESCFVQRETCISVVNVNTAAGAPGMVPGCGVMG